MIKATDYPTILIIRIWNFANSVAMIQYPIENKPRWFVTDGLAEKVL
jgi:hypothetical protein